MKKSINGKVYNTETADFIGEYSNNLGRRDFRYRIEGLYKTHKGAFFLHGEGGAMTEWGRSCADLRCEGESIRVLTPEEALDWCEQNLNLKDYESHFELDEA